MPTWNHRGLPVSDTVPGVAPRPRWHAPVCCTSQRLPPGCGRAPGHVPGAPDQEAHGFNIHTIILGFSFSLRNGFSVILFSYIFKIKFSYF